MIIEKKGFKHYIISDIINDYLITKRFLYYTKKEALRIFKQDLILIK